MNDHQITWDDVDNPCTQCKKLDMDDEVPERCPVYIILKECVE